MGIFFAVGGSSVANAYGGFLYSNPAVAVDIHEIIVDNCCGHTSATRRMALERLHAIEALPKVTPQQMAFVQTILAGKTQTDAYRDADDCANMQNRTVWLEASKTAAKQKVKT